MRIFLTYSSPAPASYLIINIAMHAVRARDLLSQHVQELRVNVFVDDQPRAHDACLARGDEGGEGGAVHRLL